jgi:hypothetical protein
MAWVANEIEEAEEPTMTLSVDYGGCVDAEMGTVSLNSSETTSAEIVPIVGGKRPLSPIPETPSSGGGGVPCTLDEQRGLSINDEDNEYRFDEDITL